MVLWRRNTSTQIKITLQWSPKVTQNTLRPPLSLHQHPLLRTMSLNHPSSLLVKMTFELYWTKKADASHDVNETATNWRMTHASPDAVAPPILHFALTAPKKMCGQEPSRIQPLSLGLVLQLVLWPSFPFAGCHWSWMV